MKNKKGNVLGWAIFGLLVVAILGGSGLIYMVATGGIGQAVVDVNESLADEVAEATNKGDVAQIKVYVRDLANNDVNTKLAIPVYCVDEEGTMIIDGASASASTEIAGSTTRDSKVSCYAFDSTHQTAEQSAGLTKNQMYLDRVIDEEIEHIVIDAYTVSTDGKISFYGEFKVGNAGLSNVTIAGEGSDSYEKMRFENNNTDKFIPLGGFYMNTVTANNISNIDMVGGAVISGQKLTSAQLKDSELTTKVSSRKDNWDYVFEIDSDPNEAGNQALLLEENDYLETSAVAVTSDVGCDAVAENLVTAKAFTKGWYRATKSVGLLYGHETDASSSSVITADIAGAGTFYCDD